MHRTALAALLPAEPDASSPAPHPDHATARLLIEPMPPRHVTGGGRDRRFALPQFFTAVHGMRTAFFDAGRGRVLLFIHGLAGNGTHWLHVAPRLAHRARVIGVDLPGCGESDKPDVLYSVPMYADHVRGLLDALGIARATLVGHSLGGMVATEFALRHRERTDAIVLIDPAGFQRMPAPLRLGGHMFLRPWLLRLLLPRTWRFILANVFTEPNEHTDAFVRMVDQTYDPVADIAHMARVMSALRHDMLERSFVDVMEHLDVPVHLIWGAEDRLVPARVFHAAARRLSHVTAEEVERCGHMPMIERPERVNALLDRVLRQV